MFSPVVFWFLLAGFVVGVLASAGAVYVARFVSGVRGRLSEVDDQVQALEGQVETLECSLARKRHTNATDAGILDSISQLNAIEFNLAESLARYETSVRLVQEARRRMGVVRKGPYAYRDEDSGRV